MGGELLGERMDDEARVAVGELAKDRGIFFFVTADGAHGGQAARNGVRASGDWLTEREVRED